MLMGDTCTYDHLDDSTASLLQVSNLFTQGQAQLEGLSTARDILAGEAPVENSDRPAQQVFLTAVSVMYVRPDIMNSNLKETWHKSV